MRTIAIVLGDNDFGNTFRPLLEGLKEIIEYRGGMTPTECELVIRQSIMAYYVGYQYRFDPVYYGDVKDAYTKSLEQKQEAHLAHIREYLNPNILFDEEAEQDILTKDHDSGAWYLELQSGIVRGY